MYTVGTCSLASYSGVQELTWKHIHTTRDEDTCFRWSCTFIIGSNWTCYLQHFQTFSAPKLLCWSSANFVFGSLAKCLHRQILEHSDIWPRTNWLDIWLNTIYGSRGRITGMYQQVRPHKQWRLSMVTLEELRNCPIPIVMPCRSCRYVRLGEPPKQIFGKSWEFGPTGLTPAPLVRWDSQKGKKIMFILHFRLF